MSVSFYKKHFNKKLARRLLEIILISVAVIALLPEIKNIVSNKDIFQEISYGWLLIAYIIYMITPTLGAASYIYLSEKPLSFIKCTLVQFSNGFVNRVLPSGTGAIATSALFLKKSGLSNAQSVSTALLNNFVGFIAFAIIMMLSGAVSHDTLKSATNNLNSLQLIAIGMILVSVLSAVLINSKLKNKTKKWALESLRSLQYLVKKPASGFMSLASNIAITIIHILCLSICLYAAGYTLPLNWLALVFAAGIATTSVSPTPNGLGLTELAMTSALENYGIPASTALLVTLSYRIVTFWGPILPGYIAYKIATNKKII